MTTITTLLPLAWGHTTANKHCLMPPLHTLKPLGQMTLSLPDCNTNILTTVDVIAINDILGHLMIASCQHLVKQVAKICVSFKPTQWDGQHNHLKLALGIKKLN